MNSVTHQEGSQAATHDAFGYDLLPELNSAQYNLQGAATTQAAQILSGFPLAGGILSGFTPPTPPNRNVGYIFDRAGNRNSMTDNGALTAYQTTSLNQYWDVGGAPVTNGSEHELSNYQNVSYTYINDLHLWTVSGTDVNGQQSKYEMYYDALGRRAVSVLNGSTTYYIYDGEKAILEYRGWSSPSAANVYGKSIDEILMRTDYTKTPALTFYYQDDHDGSVTHLTDATGNVIEYYRYDAFGKPFIYSSTSSSTSQPLNASTYGNRFLFTGREYVSVFGIYEYRNRAYHPGLGRFMSEDPKGFAAGDYNLFRYCHNDPEDLVDPMGLSDNELSNNPMFQAMQNAFNDRVMNGFGATQLAGLNHAMETISAKQVEAKGSIQKENSIAYHKKGDQIAKSDQQRLIDNPKDPQYMRYYGAKTNKDGRMEFAATDIIKGTKGSVDIPGREKESGVNKNDVYNKRADPKGEKDPMRGMGYRTVGVIVSERRALYKTIHRADVDQFHKAGLDAFVSFPPSPYVPSINVLFNQEHNVDP